MIDLQRQIHDYYEAIIDPVDVERKVSSILLGIVPSQRFNESSGGRAARILNDNPVKSGIPAAHPA